MSLWLTCSGLPAQALDEKALADLERRFYFHDFARDTNGQRLNRLEDLVFGQPASLPDAERLAAITAALAKVDFGLSLGSHKPQATAQSGPPPSSADAIAREPDRSPDYRPPSSSKYPAVLAMESRLLGGTYESESLESRLRRLETRVFGRASASDDLSARVDMLKSRTGIDVTKIVPPGADSTEDDDDYSAPPPVVARQPSRRPSLNYGSGPAAAPRQFASDTRMPRSGPAYAPPPAPAYTQSNQWPPAGTYGMAPGSAFDPGQAGGIIQQVAAIEYRVFGRVWSADPLPVRVARLEQIVFRGFYNFARGAIPERVRRLSQAVGITG